MNKLTETRKGRNLPQLGFTALTSAVVAVYLQLFRQELQSFHYDGGNDVLPNLSLAPGAIAFMAAAFVLAFAILTLLNRQRRILSFLFRWRYLFAIGLFALLVLFQISGSSLAIWSNLLDDAQFSDLEGVLFGMPRKLRTDEYAVFTPLAFSQEYTGYAAISGLPRSVPTDLTLIYAQPCWDIATLFRPFFWGYLLLGSAHGLSFFWCGRFIALFLASFEFGRYLTRDNRPFALFYAVSISLAPITQWWFSVNGTAELLIFAQVGILAFSRFLRSTTRSHRIGWASAAAYSAGCFVMVIYPAWQVSIAYFIVAFCIAEAVRCRQENVGALSRNLAARSAFVSYWLVLLCAVAIVIGLVAFSLAGSLDVIRAVGNTEYPGNRISTGGGLLPFLFDWACSWLYPLSYQTVLPNVCERAEVVSFFPLGITLALVSLRHARDPRVIAVLAVEAVLMAYGLIGFPDWLAKLTLLSHVPTNRLVFALGLCDMALLALGVTACHERALSKRPRQRRTAPQTSLSSMRSMQLAAASITFAVVATVLSLWVFDPEFASVLFACLCAAFIALATYALCTSASGDASAFQRLICITAVIAVAGLCINPIQRGINALQDSGPMQLARSISENDPEANWAGDTSVPAQALLASGIRAINSVALYPSLDTWRKIDPQGIYEKEYNRYAHITMELTDKATSFESNHPDVLLVRINADDVPKLGIDYWLTEHDLSSYSTDRVAFVKAGSSGSWSIFKIEQE